MVNKWSYETRQTSGGLLRFKIKVTRDLFAVGPEYIALVLTCVISSVTGGGWVASKVLARSHERVKQAHERLRDSEMRLHEVEEQVKRMPIEYVLKVDFLREIQQMHDHFKEINTKLDRMIEKLLR